MIDTPTSICLQHHKAKVTVTELPGQQRQVVIDPLDPNLIVIYKEFTTSYPVSLIDLILQIKGPVNLRDEIRRDEDSRYTQICLETNILAYLPESAFENKRLLDFGCGAGASAMILARRFQKTQIVGIDLSEDLLNIARGRADFYNFPHLQFLLSPHGDRLPENIGQFDFIVMSAVFEHLLPNERQTVMSQLWSCLKPGGILFLDQTPYRYFPFEGHTTRIPFLNYLPDKLAHRTACLFSKRVSRDETWPELLRRGIRGGSVKEVKKAIIHADPTSKPDILQPNQMDLRDRIDVWYAGYAVSITNKYPKTRYIQVVMKYVFKFIYRLTGIVILPTLALAIKKERPSPQS